MALRTSGKPTWPMTPMAAVVLSAAVGLAAATAGAQPAACPYVSDGVCDEPGIGTGACPAGTDAADCGTAAPSSGLPATAPAQAGVCLYLNDGVCDEPGIGTGACPAGTDNADCGTDAPPPDQPPPDAEGPGPALACPADLIGPGSGDAPATEITCHCNVWTMDMGPVWGSGPYTADSSVCRAALHAGLIAETGGSVTVRLGDGCDYYAPSTANGIDGLVWRAYPASFHFPAAGDGTCVDPPQRGPIPVEAPATVSQDDAEAAVDTHPSGGGSAVEPAASDGAIADEAAPDGLRGQN